MAYLITTIFNIYGHSSPYSNLWILDYKGSPILRLKVVECILKSFLSQVLNTVGIVCTQDYE